MKSTNESNIKHTIARISSSYFRFFIFGLVFIGVALVSCKELATETQLIYPPGNQHKVTITQGAWGDVWFWEGDFMPPINPASAKITPVVRDIYVYEALDNTKIEFVSGGAFLRIINAEPITIVRTDADGFFQISLDPGKYSFFIKEDTLFYANEWDSEGHILSANVLDNEVTKRQIDITYKAWF